MKIYRVKYWYERPAGDKPPAYMPLGLRVANKPKPDAGIPGVVRFYKDELMLMTSAWHNYWKTLLKQNAPSNWTTQQIDAAYGSLIDPGRFATNFSSPPEYKLMSLTCGGNYFFGDDTSVSKAGQLYIKIYMLDSLKPPPDPTVINFQTRPGLIHLTINERIAKLSDGTYTEEPFPQLGGNNVPFPVVAKNGFDWILADALEEVPAIGAKGYYNPAPGAITPPAPIYTVMQNVAITVTSTDPNAKVDVVVK